jgi:GNAT superfamily N-acetyltransferase
MVAAMVEIRLCESNADSLRSLEIYNAVWPSAAVTIDEVRSFEAAARAHADHLAVVEGRAVGSGFVAVMPARPSVGHLLLTVLPEYRSVGAGSALLSAVSQWALGQGAIALEARVEEDDERSLAWAASRGFEEIERNGGMELDLSDIESPPADPAAGVELVTLAERPELTRGVYEVYREAAPDIPGGSEDEIEPFSDWFQHEMSGSGDRLDATFVAVDGDEVVGYAKFSLTEAQADVAFHDMTAVKRARRGRGIARALKHAQVRWAKEHGYRRLRTSNELRNEPIRRLNERLGYRPVPGWVLVRAPLSALQPS